MQRLLWLIRLTNSHFPYFSPRIQDLDGGFFEKFGSLLKQKSIYEDERESTPLAPLPDINGEAEDEVPVDEVQLEARSMAYDSAEKDEDSGRETLSDSDAEDAQSVLGQLIEDAFGWNVSKWVTYYVLWICNRDCISESYGRPGIVGRRRARIKIAINSLSRPPAVSCKCRKETPI